MILLESSQITQYHVLAKASQFYISGLDLWALMFQNTMKLPEWDKNYIFIYTHQITTTKWLDYVQIFKVTLT